MLAYLAFAELCGMTLWFSATAITPTLVVERGLSSSQAAWLTMSVQAGFVVGTLASALLNLADIWRARTLMFFGCLIGAAANVALISAPSGGAMIALRLTTGVALAAVYPPGMKLAAGWFREQRGLALGVLIGALTLGKSAPHLLTQLVGESWSALMLVSSSLALTGGAVAFLLVRDGPFVTATSRFDARAAARVLREPGARLATFGYLGHMWELYAMWSWIAVLAGASFAGAGVAGASSAGSMAAFLAIGSGAAGCVMAGWLADRVGRARVAMWALWTSAACAALTPLAFGGPPRWFYLLVMIWGFAVVADSAQFSALVSEHAPPDHVGTALTLQTCLGFLLTMVTIDLMPRVAEVVGWRFAAWLLVPGPLLGVLAMERLRRRSPV